jgi:hypothetical protein
MQMGFDKCTEQTVTAPIPMPLFYCDDKFLLPPACECELILNVNPYYANDIVGFVNQSLPVNALTSSSNSTANSIGVGVDSITLWMSQYRKGIPRMNELYVFPLMQLQSQIRDITSNNTSMTFNFESEKLSKVLVAFIPTKRGTLKCASNDFSSGYSNASPEVKYTNNAVSSLQSLQIQYGSQIFPSPNYTLKFNNFGGNVNLEDNMRAYYELINNIGLRTDRTGGYSYDEWVNEPVFVYNLSELNPSKNMVVNLRFDSNFSTSSDSAVNPNPMQLFVVAIYEQKLLIKYSDPLNYAVDLSN